ncbi:hypothetical protein WJ438_24215 [Streptomyces sp. GD-15H]|uniref:hypothetical protein n=1 Tax=Streptomyces sp. GD-15H TaxID=3129112 RepID=UPI00324C9DCC
MKIAKLVKIAAGGLAVLALSVGLSLEAGVTSGHSVEVAADGRSGSVTAIDWP